jgi:hypothetical protein
MCHFIKAKFTLIISLIVVIAIGYTYYKIRGYKPITY